MHVHTVSSIPGGCQDTEGVLDEGKKVSSAEILLPSVQADCFRASSLLGRCLYVHVLIASVFLSDGTDLAVCVHVSQNTFL